MCVFASVSPGPICQSPSSLLAELRDNSPMGAAATLKDLCPGLKVADYGGLETFRELCSRPEWQAMKGCLIDRGTFLHAWWD